MLSQHRAKLPVWRVHPAPLKTCLVLRPVIRVRWGLPLLCRALQCVISVVPARFRTAPAYSIVCYVSLGVRSRPLVNRPVTCV